MVSKTPTRPKLPPIKFLPPSGEASARGSNLAADPTDVRLCFNGKVRWMASPFKLGTSLLKRTVCRLNGGRYYVFCYPFEAGDWLQCISDRAGCARTRKITTNWGHVLRTWNSTQSIECLSLGEAANCCAVRVSWRAGNGRTEWWPAQAHEFQFQVDTIVCAMPCAI